MKEVDVLILGAGIAGLGAYTAAIRSGRQAVIYEKNSRAGGLLDNFSIQGFRFDNAVHLSFATEPEVRAVFDQAEFYTHPADSLNFEVDKWLKHPVQNNLYPLDVEDKVELITSLIERDNNLEGQDYESWLRHQYGNLIAERFPIRYTRKYWKTEASKLSTTWIGNRMRRADYSEIIHGALTPDTPNTYYTKEMRYPKKGGYLSFLTPLINGATICLNKEAISISLKSNLVEFADGEVVRYKSLVNTLPLPLFINLCTSVPQPVKEAVSKLRCTSIDLLSVGFSEPIINDLWFYIYDEDILASRAYSPSVKSPYNAPKGCSSLQFEVYSSERSSHYTPDELVDNVRYALQKMGISNGENILFIEHKHLEWGNVIFDLGMESYRSIVLNYLDENSVKSCGRFGLWEYFWSNQAYMSGYSLTFK